MRQFCLVLLVISVFSLGVNAQPEPAWTPIMNVGGTTNEASAQYVEFNNSWGPYAISTPSTNLGYHNTLYLPLVNGTNQIEQVGQLEAYSPASQCPGHYGPAGQMFKSYWGPWNYPTSTYKGLAAQLTFGYNGADIIGPGGSSYNLEQTVYFGENQCADGGGEYGVWLNGFTGQVDFYILTAANHPEWCSGCVVHHTLGANQFVNSQYLFEIWPVYDGQDGQGNAVCHFETRIYGSQNDTGQIYPNTAMLQYDPAFCTRMVGNQGYVTATTKNSQVNYNGNNAYNTFKMNIGGIWIGK